MRRLLTILGAISITASSSSAVVACTVENETDFAINNYFNNSLENILTSGLERSKSIILDNEYGIDANITNSQLYSRSVSETTSNVDTNDFQNQDGTIGDLVQRYFGTKQYNNNNTKAGTHVNIGNKNGSQSGLDNVISNLLKNYPILRNNLIQQKSSILGLLNTTKNSVSAPSLENMLNEIYNLIAGGSDFPINTALQVGVNWLNSNLDQNTINTIVDVLSKLLSTKDTISNTLLPSILNNGTGIMGSIRLLMSKVFDNDSLAKNIYENAPIEIPDFKLNDGKTTITTTPSSDVKISDIKIEDAKTQGLLSINRILEKVVDFSKQTDKPDASSANPLDTLSYHVSFIINELIKGNKLSINKMDQKNIQDIIFESLRLIAIFNAYINFFENTHNFNPTKTTELFDFSTAKIDGRNVKTNYEYLNTFMGKTLGDSDMVKDESINISYFISNMDYFLGSLKDSDDLGAYRIQQFLFLLLNDPTPSITDPSKPATDVKSYANKNSVIADFITRTGFITAQKWAKNNLNNSIAKALGPILNGLVAEPNKTVAIENSVVKPLVLGLSNGDDFGSILDVVYGGLTGAVVQFKEQLRPIQSIVDDAMKIVARAKDNKQVRTQTVHFLINGDVRPFLEGTNFIPNEWLVKLFDSKPINLTTIANLPLHNIMSIFNVSGFKGGMISAFGDDFTLKSIPELFSLLNSYFNELTDNSTAVNYLYKNADGTMDWTKSLKSKNINLQAIYDWFIQFVGTDTNYKDGYKVNDGSNIISRLLTDFLVAPQSSTDPKEITTKDNELIVPGSVLSTTNKKIPTIRISLENVGKDLGMTGQHKYSAKGIIGAMYRLLLPKIGFNDSRIDSNQNITIKAGTNPTNADSDYQVDLLHHAYSNLITFMFRFDSPGDYSPYVYELLRNEKIFSFNYDPSSIKYFKNQKGLIKSLTYRVNFLNTTTGKTNTYIFRISRNSNADAFNIDSITTNKLD